MQLIYRLVHPAEIITIEGESYRLAVYMPRRLLHIEWMSSAAKRWICSGIT